MADESRLDESRLEELRRLCAAPLPHPDVAEMRRAGESVLRFAIKDYTDLPDRPIGAYATPRHEMEAIFRQEPPEHGQPFESVMAEFERFVSPNSLRVSHPRFMAFIPGAPSFPSILGDWLASTVNFFAGVWKEAPSATLVELVVLDWFKEFLGYPAEAQGILTSGGSEANLTALVVARERLVFADRSRALIYVSEHRHWSVDRAARVMGLGQDQIVVLPAAADGRFSIPDLEKAVQSDTREGLLPWVVVANAGATNTGVVDPLDALADLCGRRKLWLHVDAAYGWPAVLCAGEMLRGIDRADSITFDPHKWFGQTFEAGGLLIRDGKELTRSFAMLPEYMQDVAADEGEVNFADRGIALTRRFRALKIWFSMKILGVGWFRRLVEHCCWLAEMAQLLIEESGRFEILSPHQLSVVCFRYLPETRGKTTDEELNRLNLAICEDIRRQGRFFLSTTRLRDQVALRLCFVNWRTRSEDVAECIEALVNVGERLSAGNV